MDPTKSEPPVRLLDLTRLVRRAGRPMTGVDRVEYAYLTHLPDHGPLYGLIRSSMGYILLDQRGCAHLARCLEDGRFARATASPLQRLDPSRAAAEREARRHCLARCLPLGLGRMVRRHLPQGVHYLNTGHSNLTPRVCAAMKARGARIGVLIHDTIPLDAPDVTRPDRSAAFATSFRRAVTEADVILCNSAQTERDVLRHAAPHCPRTQVALLGVDPMPSGKAPAGPWTGQPYFVTLGTIEPRKNHALLLDLWGDIPDAHLLICGSRGWLNEDVFKRLDARPDRVHELPGLDDAAVSGLLRHAAGALFPSLIEGYGLPPIEAAALKVPVLCNDLPIYRETLGDIPVYADVKDRYLWVTKIRQMAEDHRAGRQQAPHYTPPSWEAHFKAALTVI